MAFEKRIGESKITFEDISPSEIAKRRAMFEQAQYDWTVEMGFPGDPMSAYAEYYRQEAMKIQRNREMSDEEKREAVGRIRSPRWTPPWGAGQGRTLELGQSQPYGDLVFTTATGGTREDEIDWLGLGLMGAFGAGIAAPLVAPGLFAGGAGAAELGALGAESFIPGVTGAGTAGGMAAIGGAGAGAGVTGAGAGAAAASGWGATEAILASSIIGGAATVGTSLLASGAAGEAAEIQAQAQREATALTRSEFEQTRAGLQEALNLGLIDIDTANKAAEAALTGGFAAARDVLEPAFAGAVEQLEPLAGLEELNLARSYLADPSQIFDLPGVQFQFETGERALENILSKTTGGGLSGDIIKAAQEYGQGFAATQLDRALNRLFPFIDLSTQARTNIANLLVQKGGVLSGLGAEEGIRLANLAAGLGTQRADLRMRGAGGQAGFVAQALPGLTKGITDIGAIQAGGLINQANIGTNLASEISRILSGGTEQLVSLRGQEQYNELLKNIIRGNQTIPTTFSPGVTGNIARQLDFEGYKFPDYLSPY